MNMAFSNIYMKSLREIILYHGMRYHQYLDETQLYITISGHQSDVVAALLQYCEVL